MANGKAKNAKPAKSGRNRAPTIVCVNHATVPLGIDFDKLIAALQAYVDDHVAPVWGTPAKLVKGKHLRPGMWGLIFVDHADHARSLAFHDVTPDGYPLSRVFVEATLKDEKLVSVSSSHELVEMLADPAVNLQVRKPRTRVIYQYEAADPVEDLTFKVNGVPMSNFVYPTWFEGFHKPASVPFDHLGELTKPFEIHAEGYQGVYKNGKWIAKFSSRAKQRRFARQDRRGHRSERRASQKPALASGKHTMKARRTR